MHSGSLLTSEYVLRSHEGRLEQAEEVDSELAARISKLDVGADHYLNRRLAEAKARVRKHCR